MKKQLPTTLAQLIPPQDAESGYRYFEAADKCPFAPNETQFSKANAWWCAEASMLAYCDENFVRSAMPKNWTHEAIPCDPAGSTQAFAMVHPSVCIIAFRGTQLKPLEQVVKDTLADIEFLPIPALGLDDGALVHRGFWKEYEQVASLVSAQVAKAGDRKIWFTGHSLGGALAFLAGAKHTTAQGIYTFGMPFVGNRSLNQVAGVQGKLHRVVHASDFVPSLPPFPRYVHSATTHLIDQNGEFVQSQGFLAGFADAVSSSFLTGTVLVSNVTAAMSALGPHFDGPLNLLPPTGRARFLTDHSPLYYATHLFNLME